ncbi:hypothetical protein G7Z17_g825 [Cylindrodendrum hubeiense]|uniref:Enoyl reductase (ER) domain-containing protein n=1 Tax=Cylindrodendrum hubeiense TaxID=595255 RepID=A0A9P5HJK6_9HYPO|nr:hypothetical protein G7Z17_g825 [Cylindrodendrum hubeiense]
MSRRWILTGQEGFEVSLKYEQDVQVPSADDLGPTEVLVKIYSASLNYRELVIARGGVNGPISGPVVPGCDGAGVVEAVGSEVKDFQVEDRVVTYFAPRLVESSGDNAFPGHPDVTSMLGQGIDGVLRSKGVFPAAALVHAPTSLGWLQTATLPCTWVTAWNSLFGIKGKEAGPGTWVLVQGTGGVSIATLQLARAVGATVVATTSTDDKAARLKALGATHTVNYRSNPDNWAQEARSLTPDKRGFDIVIDVAGNETLAQSLTAVRVDGVVMVIGMVGGHAEPVPLFAAMLHTCIVRGIIAGSRSQLRELVSFIDENKITPAIDDVVFELAEVKDAYRRLEEKRHFAKVVIKINHAKV